MEINKASVKEQRWRYSGILNFTMEDYNRLLEEQKSCCAICNTHSVLLKGRLVVDHDHETGEVRGLLCGKCNSLLGFASDSAEILHNAISYIEPGYYTEYHSYEYERDCI